MKHTEIQVNKQRMLNETVSFEDIAFKMNITHEEQEQIEAKKKYYRTLIALRATREEKGLTQDELAERSGIAKATISKIESGKRNVTVDTLITLAGAMGKKIEINLV
jgi:DNA-binding XRE family transcriptional regulator